MKILGIDFGSKRIGLAIGNSEIKIATPYSIINRIDLNKDINEIKKIVKEKDIEKIVIGLPKNMNNTLGEMSKEVENFIKELKKNIDISIDLWDERLTSIQAEKSLIKADISRSKRKKLKDKIAASIMLQSYLEKHFKF